MSARIIAGLATTLFAAASAPLSAAEAPAAAECVKEAQAYGASQNPADLLALKQCLGQPTLIASPECKPVDFSLPIFGEPSPNPGMTLQPPITDLFKDFIKNAGSNLGDGTFVAIMPGGTVVTAKKRGFGDFSIEDVYTLAPSAN